MPAGVIAVDFGDDERHAFLEAVGPGLVDRDCAAANAVRHELATGFGAHREQAEVEIAGRQSVRRRRLDREDVELGARGALARESADVLVAALAKEGEGDAADGAGRADDYDRSVAAHPGILPSSLRTRSSSVPRSRLTRQVPCSNTTSAQSGRAL